MKPFTIALTLASAASLLASAPAIAGVSSGDFFALGNAGAKGLYHAQVGVHGSDTLLSPLQSDVHWYDLAPGFNASYVFAMRNNTLVTLSTADGSELTSVKPDKDFINIATDTATSTVYAVVSGVPGTAQPDELITVDPITGQTTTIGQLGAASAGLYFAGLGFDPVTGNLFMTAEGGLMFSINTTTGMSTLVGNTGIYNPYDIDYNPADGQMYLIHGGTNTLFMVDRDDASLLPSTELHNISLSTGLAFAIPTPGSAAILGFATLAALRRRR